MLGINTCVGREKNTTVLQLNTNQRELWGLAPFLDNHTLLVGPQGKQVNPIVLQFLITK